MLDKLTSQIGFHADALVLRAERQRVIASNIANADTPGYVARDFNFKQAIADAQSGGLGQALTQQGAAADGRSHARHIPVAQAAGTYSSASGQARPSYALNSQPAMDNNTVDLDRERASFVDNAIRYEATLRFVSGKSKTLLSAIQGQ